MIHITFKPNPPVEPLQIIHLIQKTKHIKRRFNSIRNYVQDGDIDICKVHTDLNVADPLTKPLPRAKHDQHQNSMGVPFITM